MQFESKTPETSPCPKKGCGFALWPSAKPRRVRFHDLRHTTATLMLKAGVSLAVVQRVLGHTSPLMTADIYGHLDLDDMRAGVERLSFLPIDLPLAEVLPMAVGASETVPHCAPVVRNTSREHSGPRAHAGESSTLPRG